MAQRPAAVRQSENIDNLRETIAHGDTGLHGVPTDNPALMALLDVGNQMRYGTSEQGRVDMVSGLKAPGVRDVAYDESGKTGFDPAAAERYTSAYLFGRKHEPNDSVASLLHGISGGSRRAMHTIGVPGVGEERERLTSAESLGMKRGSEAGGDARSRAIQAFLRGLGVGRGPRSY